MAFLFGDGLSLNPRGSDQGGKVFLDSCLFDVVGFGFKSFGF